MALFNSISDANLVRTTGPTITFSTEPSFNDAGTAVDYYSITRTKTEAFSYVGLTEEAAIAAAETLRKEYTREYQRWTADVVDGEVVVCPAWVRECLSTFVPSHQAGCAWQLDCTINEQDTKISLEDIAEDEFDDLFLEQSARDVVSGSIAISEVQCYESQSNKVYIDFEQKIENFNYRNLAVEYCKSDSDTWQSLSGVLLRNSYIEFTADETTCWIGDKVRIVYDSSIYSNEAKVLSAYDPNLSVSNASVSLVPGGSTILHQAYTSSGLKSYYTYVDVISFKCRVHCEAAIESLHIVATGGDGTQREFLSSGSTRTFIVDSLGNNEYEISCSDGCGSKDYTSPWTITATLPKSSLYGKRATRTASAQTADTNPGFNILSATMDEGRENIIVTAKTANIPLSAMQTSLSVVNLQTSALLTVSDVTLSGDTWTITIAVPFDGSGGTSINSFDGIRYGFYLKAQIDSKNAAPSPSVQVDTTSPIEFVTTLLTDGTSPICFNSTNEPFSVATGTTFDIDWGDGTVESGLSSALGLSHTYSGSGAQQIKITGRISAFGNDNGTSVLESLVMPFTSISFASCVHEIKPYAFSSDPSTSNISLTSITFEGSVTLASGAFMFNDCLDSVYADSLVDAETDVFGGNTSPVVDLRCLGRTWAEVQAMSGFSDAFGLSTSSRVFCSDGTHQFNE